MSDVSRSRVQPAPAPPREPPPELVPGEEAPPTRGWLLQAILLGLVWQALVTGWIIYSEIPAKVYISSWSFSMPGVFVLALAMLAARCWRPLARGILSRRSLLLAYMMVAVSGILAGYGALQIAVPMLAGLVYRTITGNTWERFSDHFPAYLVPRDADALAGLFLGQSRVPWNVWLLPICGWLAFLMALYGAMLFLSAILSRQWIEGERLTFPVAQLPLEMTNTAHPMYRNRLFWIGFAAPAVLETLLAFNYYYPNVPAIQLKHVNMQPMWFPDRPLSVMNPFYFGASPFIVGLAYFAPLDVTFSVFFFNQLAKAERVYGAMMGYDAETSSGGSTFPFPEEQTCGAFLAFALAALWRTWPSIRAAWHDRRRSDEEARLMLRSVVGLAICCALSLWFFVQAGLPLSLGMIALVVILLVAVTLSRIRAEAGPSWVFGPSRDLSTQLVQSLGTASMGENSLIGLGLFRWISRDPRFLPMPFHLEALKIAHGAGIRKRTALAVMFLATAVGILLGFYFVLTYGYSLGLASSKASPGRISGAVGIWRTSMTWISTNTPADTASIPWMIVGAGICWTLMALRTLFTWWPFHPIGYVMAETGAGRSFWFHYFLAWLFKLIVLRYGGHSLYVKSLPLVVGIILGDVLTQTAWSALAVLIDIPVYQFIS